jgi:cold shock protein
MIEEGTVKWFSDTLGFGCITRQSNAEVSVNRSNIRGEGFKTLAEGDRVRFVAFQGRKGWEAKNVEKIIL